MENWEKEGKIGKRKNLEEKSKNREGSFTLPFLTVWLVRLLPTKGRQLCFKTFKIKKQLNWVFYTQTTDQ